MLGQSWGWNLSQKIPGESPEAALGEALSSGQGLNGLSDLSADLWALTVSLLVFYASSSKNMAGQTLPVGSSSVREGGCSSRTLRQCVQGARGPCWSLPPSQLPGGCDPGTQAPRAQGQPLCSSRAGLPRCGAFGGAQAPQALGIIGVHDAATLEQKLMDVKLYQSL